VASARVAKDRLLRTVQVSELIGRSSPKNYDTVLPPDVQNA
jgi:hypothetical protein